MKLQNPFGPTAHRLMIKACELTAVKHDETEI